MSEKGKRLAANAGKAKAKADIDVWGNWAKVAGSVTDGLIDTVGGALARKEAKKREEQEKLEEGHRQNAYSIIKSNLESAVFGGVPYTDGTGNEGYTQSIFAQAAAKMGTEKQDGSGLYTYEDFEGLVLDKWKGYKTAEGLLALCGASPYVTLEDCSGWLEENLPIYDASVTQRIAANRTALLQGEAQTAFQRDESWKRAESAAEGLSIKEYLSGYEERYMGFWQDSDGETAKGLAYWDPSGKLYYGNAEVRWDAAVSYAYEKAKLAVSPLLEENGLTAAPDIIDLDPALSPIWAELLEASDGYLSADDISQAQEEFYNLFLDKENGFIVNRFAQETALTTAKFNAWSENVSRPDFAWPETAEEFHAVLEQMGADPGTVAGREALARGGKMLCGYSIDIRYGEANDFLWDLFQEGQILGWQSEEKERVYIDGAPYDTPYKTLFDEIDGKDGWSPEEKAYAKEKIQEKIAYEAENRDEKMKPLLEYNLAKLPQEEFQSLVMREWRAGNISFDCMMEYSQKRSPNTDLFNSFMDCGQALIVPQGKNKSDAGTLSFEDFILLTDASSTICAALANGADPAELAREYISNYYNTQQQDEVFAAMDSIIRALNTTAYFYDGSLLTSLAGTWDAYQDGTIHIEADVVSDILSSFTGQAASQTSIDKEEFAMQVIRGRMPAYSDAKWKDVPLELQNWALAHMNIAMYEAQCLDRGKDDCVRTLSGGRTENCGLALLDGQLAIITSAGLVFAPSAYDESYTVWEVQAPDAMSRLAKALSGTGQPSMPRFSMADLSGTSLSYNGSGVTKSTGAALDGSDPSLYGEKTGAGAAAGQTADYFLSQIRDNNVLTEAEDARARDVFERIEAFLGGGGDLSELSAEAADLRTALEHLPSCGGASAIQRYFNDLISSPRALAVTDPGGVGSISLQDYRISAMIKYFANEREAR